MKKSYEYFDNELPISPIKVFFSFLGILARQFNYLICEGLSHSVTVECASANTHDGTEGIKSGQSYGVYTSLVYIKKEEWIQPEDFYVFI